MFMEIATLSVPALAWRLMPRLSILPVFGAVALALCAGLRADPVAHADRQPPEQALRILIAAKSSVTSATSASSRADLLARISTAWADKVDRDEHRKNRAAAKEDAQKAVETAEQAVKADAKNAQAHLSLSIACGKMTDFVDNSTKMALSKRIRDEAQRTIALDPKEDLAYHILGRWNFGIATLNPVLRFAARMTYGALPPASLEEAARDLEQAASLAPRRIMHHQQLALVYKAMGQPEKAAQQWKLVLALPVVESDDAAAKKQARAALGK